MKVPVLCLLAAALLGCPDHKPPRIGDPLIFTEAFEPGTIVHLDGQTVLFETSDPGRLRIRDGRIVCGDPLIRQQPYTVTFPNGDHAITLSWARTKTQKRLAFLRVRFGNRHIRSWQMLLRPGQAITQLNANQYFGVDIKSGLLFISDEDTYDRSNAQLPLLAEKFDHTLGISRFPISKQDTLLILKPGNGVYAAYVGLDDQQQPVVLLLDFNLVPWHEGA